MQKERERERVIVCTKKKLSIYEIYGQENRKKPFCKLSGLDPIVFGACRELIHVGFSYGLAAAATVFYFTLNAHKILLTSSFTFISIDRKKITETKTKKILANRV